MTINDKEKFAKEFIDQYKLRGFGSMTKNDFEVLIFELLRKHGDLGNKTNYEISVILQIPEAKVKKLAYESDLKYHVYTEQDIIREFFNKISKSKFRGDSDKIQFVIEDKFLRSSISSELKKLGHYSDSSFNSEIISIHIDSFIDLLEIFYPDFIRKEIVKEGKKAVNKAKGDKLSFKIIMKKFFEGMATQAGKKIVDIGAFFVTGGVEHVPDIIKIAKDKL